MRRIFFLVQKELIQIFRDKGLLSVMLIAPIFQMILLPFAADSEIRNIKYVIVDLDNSEYSKSLINKFQNNLYFELKGIFKSKTEALKLVENGSADMMINIPSDFEKNLINRKISEINLLIDAVNNTKAMIINIYSTGIINEFNNELVVNFNSFSLSNSKNIIELESRFWYNPSLNYKTLMVPGIIAELCALITMLLSALNVVKEKEIGTIEQLNVTPLKKYELIIGKLIPFWIIGQFIYWVGLLIGKIVFDIPIEGSLLLQFVFISVFLLFVLGIGLLISTFVNTQQEALFVSFFFIVLFIMISGLFTPAEYLPEWVKIINIVNPIRYAVEVNRLVLIKGSGWGVISKYIGIVGLFAIIVNLFAVLRYKKAV